MLGLNTVKKLGDKYIAQAMNCFEANKLPIGLLINFAAKSLEFQCFYNQNHPENRDCGKN